MISFRQKGDFSKLTRFLEKAKEAVRLGDLDVVTEDFIETNFERLDPCSFAFLSFQVVDPFAGML